MTMSFSLTHARRGERRLPRLSGKARRKLLLKLASGLELQTPSQAIGRLLDLCRLQGKRREARLLEHWHGGLAQGRTLSEVLQDGLPDREVMLISAHAANPAHGLRRAAAITERSSGLVASIVGSVSYPLLILLAILFATVLLDRTFVPVMSALVPVEEWRGWSAALLWVSAFARYGVPPLLAVLVVVGVTAWWSMPRWTGRLRRWADRFPPWSIYRLWIGVSFLESYAALSEASRPPTEILRQLGQQASPYLQDQIRAISRAQGDGLSSDVAQALARTGRRWPDPELVHDLEAYGNSPALPAHINRLIADWQAETVERVQRVGRALNAVMMVVGGLILGPVVMSVMAIQRQIGDAIAY